MLFVVIRFYLNYLTIVEHVLLRFKCSIFLFIALRFSNGVTTKVLWHLRTFQYQVRTQCWYLHVYHLAYLLLPLLVDLYYPNKIGLRFFT